MRKALTSGYLAPLLCLEVAGHAVMAGGVHAVGRKLHLQAPVARQPVVFGRRRARLDAVGQHDDAGMVRAYAYLVLGADHSVGFHAAQFRFLDLEFFVAVIQHGAHGGHNHGLAGRHVRRAAHYGHRLRASQVHAGDMKMVGIRMCLAAKYFAYDYAAESAADAFHFLNCVALQSCRCQCRRQFARLTVYGYVPFQPFI